VAVTVYQAKTRLSRILQQVESGEEVVVCRAKQPIAAIVPSSSLRCSRPKVGSPTSHRFAIPEHAFAPFSDDEIKDWGL
jgi:antitoxin (DNA-binding transcriptional repressor) of toxin-antitoxin stability system